MAMALALVTVQAVAQSDAAPPDPAPDGEAGAGTTTPALWSAGLFMVGADHAVYPGAERRTRNATALPFITYRGPVVRLEGGTAGLRTLRTPRAELDFSAAAAFGSDGKDTGAREGMPAVGTLVELGPSVRIQLGELDDDGRRSPWRLDLPLRAAFDADRDFRYAGISFEPRLNWRLPRLGDWSPSTYAGLMFGTRALNSLYYDVPSEYATPARPAYDARGGLVATRLGVSLSRALGDDLRLGLHASMETVKGAANRDSPVVGRSVDHTLAITLTWTAWRSDARGVE